MYKTWVWGGAAISKLTMCEMEMYPRTSRRNRKEKKKQIQGNGIVSVATPIAFSQTRLREGQEGGGGDVGDSDMTTAEGYG